MGSNPRENKEYHGIIVDRDGPDNSVKVFIPELHGRDVKVEHLGWSRFTVPPGQGAATTNYGTPDTGQMVKCVVNTTGGSMLVNVTGLLQTKQSSEPANPGNFSLNFLPQWADAVAKELPVRIRPNIEEVVEGGKKIRKIVEKGQKHNHGLLKELNSTGAPFPLNGTILPSITMDTATQQAIMSPTLDLLNALPGVNIPMSNLLSLIPSDLMSELTSKIPPSVMTGFTNMSALMSSLTPAPSAGSMVNIARMDPTTLITNAVSMLGNVQSVEDIASVFSELTTNTELQGLGNIASAMTSMIDSPFGPITQVFNPLTGIMENIIPDSIGLLMQGFSGMLGELPGAGGAGLFGNAFETMNAMSQRLSPELQKKFKKVMEENISTAKGTDMRKKLNEFGSDANSAALGYKKMFEKFGVL